MTQIYRVFIAFWHTRKYYKSSTQTRQFTHKTNKCNKINKENINTKQSNNNKSRLRQNYGYNRQRHIPTESRNFSTRKPVHKIYKDPTDVHQRQYKSLKNVER